MVTLPEKYRKLIEGNKIIDRKRIDIFPAEVEGIGGKWIALIALSEEEEEDLVNYVQTQTADLVSLECKARIHGLDTFVDTVLVMKGGRLNGNP